MSCSVYGYYEYISRKEFKLKKLAGKLISETAVKRGIQVHVTKTWDLNFPQKIALRHGYSGSPVIDTAKEMVVGIVRIKEDQSGQRGLAISVEAVLRLTGKLKQEHKKLRNHIHSVLRSDYGFDDLPDISHFETANCNLLPYLADRKAQLDQLGKIVSRHLPKSNATPIIIILHGEECQRPERFITSLEKHHWEARHFTGPEEPSILCQDIGLPRIDFKDYGEFHDSLLNELNPPSPIERIQSFDDIAREFNRRVNQPVMLQLRLRSDEWQQVNGKILEYFIEFWKNWPLRRKGRVLIACLIIKYMKAHATGRLWKRLLKLKDRIEETNKQIREQLQIISEKNNTDVPVVILDELKCITRRMAENWTQMDVIKTTCGTHDFTPFIQTLYSTVKEHHMEGFAEEAYKELKTILPSCQ